MNKKIAFKMIEALGLNREKLERLARGDKFTGLQISKKTAEFLLSFIR